MGGKRFAPVLLCFAGACAALEPQAGDAPAAARCPPEGCPKQPGQDDTASLLQRTEVRKQLSPERAGESGADLGAGGARGGGEPPCGKPAVTFQGNGYRALPPYAAVMSSLLKFLPGNSRRWRRGVERLLSSFGTVTGISAGTWFTTSLAYSPRFLKLVQKMSLVSAAEAAALFDKFWFTPLELALNLGSGLFALEEAGVNLTALDEASRWRDHIAEAGALRGVAGLEGKTPASQQQMGGGGRGAGAGTIPIEDQFDAIFGGTCLPGADWTLFTTILLLTTASILPTQTLGDDVADWAVGKTWLPCTTLVTPGGVNFEDTALTLITGDPGGVSFQSESAEVGDQFNVYIPAKFSIVWGEGKKAKAPLPYCATAGCFGLEHAFSANTTSGEDTANSGSLGSSFQGSFSDAGKLSLVSVTSASSAAAGSFVLLPPSLCNVSRSSIALGVFTDSHPACSTFRGASRQLDTLYGLPPAEAADFGLSKLAPSDLAFHIDGAYTDNTGILQAVASGVTTTTSWINDPLDFFGLFKGANLTSVGNFPTFLALNYFQIFSTPVEEVQRQVANFECFDVPPTTGTSLPSPNGEAPFLISLCFGTVRTVTMYNKLAGIKPGKKVTINAINVVSSLDLGPSTVPLDFSNYTALVREVGEAMQKPGNRRLTKKLLKEFFLAV